MNVLIALIICSVVRSNQIKSH